MDEQKVAGFMKVHCSSLGKILRSVAPAEPVFYSVCSVIVLIKLTWNMALEIYIENTVSKRGLRRITFIIVPGDFNGRAQRVLSVFSGVAR